MISGVRAAVPGAPVATVDEARATMLAAITPLDAVESVPIGIALDRITAEDVRAAIDLPPFSHSAMDGYAVSRCVDETISRFRVVGKAYAGHVFSGKMAPGECIAITTGACVPADALAVIPNEEVIRHDGWITVKKPIALGSHIRPRAEERRAGDVVLNAGRRLRAPQLGMLVASGLETVPAFRRLRVALFSTGDELRTPGQALRAGQIYDSNQIVLEAALNRLGVACRVGGMLPDDTEACRDALDAAARQADFMVVSGGASVGEADVLAGALASLGEVRPWRVAMKPGQRLLFGQIGECVCVGLPGNPIAALVAFNQFALPLLRKRSGEHPLEPVLRIQARLSQPLSKGPGRREFVRAVWSTEHGGTSVTPLAAQGSAMLSSVSDANCFIVLPEPAGEWGVGDRVEIEPFAGWL